MRQLITFCLCITLMGISAQAPNPVTWMAKYQPVSVGVGEIVITAAIEKGWHTYSQRPTSDGPVPTSFTFTPVKGYQLDGKIGEADAKEEFEKAFDAKVFVFTNKAEFRQKIKIIGKTPFEIPLKVEYMSCNDMMCLPPKTVELRVKVQ